MVTIRIPRSSLTLALIAWSAVVMAQTKYWTGGTGAWNDASRWSFTPGGPGGAGVPRVNEDVVVSMASVISISGTNWCRSLHVDGRAGQVQVDGPLNAELNIAGEWRMLGEVRWDLQGDVRLIKRQGGVEVELHGIPIHGDVVLDGSGTWSLHSDLVVADHRSLRLREGTLITNGDQLRAGRLLLDGRGAKQIIAGSSVVRLQEVPDPLALREVLDPGTSVLAVGGNVVPWGVPTRTPEQADRDVNVCGTGPGQTPFVVNAQLTSNYNGFGVQCRGVCNATVTATVSGGSGTFTFAWLNGGPNSATWTTACGGPQIVIVTDVVQGISCPAQVNVTEPAPLGVLFFGQGTAPTCADVCDGSRTALAVGGVNPISYNWNNGAGTNSSFFELCAGVNTLLVTDANGCTFDTTFIFNVQPIAPNLTFTPTSCFGACDGSAEVTPVGGTGVLTVTWNPGGLSGNSVTGLCAGNYTVQLADANGCDTTLNFTITQPLPLDLVTISADASCFGTCDGTAGVTVSGSPGPFTYTWSPAPGTGQGSSNAQGLCQGTYSLNILDQSSGCDTTLTFLIDAPPAIDVQGTVTDASCSSSCDGAVILVVTGGQAPYTYAWSPSPPVGQGTSNVSGLCAGDVDVTVTDASGCDTTLTFTINAPPPIVPGLTTTDVTCAGACDGSATAATTGGSTPYSYTWTPAPGQGQGTNTALGLCAGNYTLLIEDDNGCDTTLTFTILEPLPLSVVPTQTNVTCGGACDGTASAVITGGVPNYTYVWTPAPPVGQGTASASGLCPGTWTLEVTDANGCVLAVPFTITDAVPITLSLQVTPASCPGVCDGTAGVIAGGGVAPYSYTWAPAPGTGQGTPVVTGLCPQAYTLTVVDAVGCDTTIAFTVTAPTPIVVTAVQDDASCAGDCDGSISLTTTGGNGTFTYLWTPAPGAGQGTANASQLCANTYSVLITSGACDTTLTFTIAAPPPIVPGLTTTDATCAGECDGSATAATTGGNPPYSYTWTPAPGQGQGTNIAQGLCAGNYTLLIEDDNGCDTTLTFTILEPPPLSAVPTQTNVTCGGACDGTASAVITGGVPNYTYVWNPAPPVGQGTASASGLCPGTWTLEVTDANGCVLAVPFTITDAVPITLSLQVTPASCPGICDGMAGVIAGGGVAPYSYTWAPAPGTGQGTPVVTGLCPQAYTLTVADAVGCDTTIAFTVTASAPIEATALVNEVGCAGDCDGSISLTTTGGNGTFTYLWTPAPGAGQGTPNATLLCANTYSVLITSGACDTTLTFTITEPAPIDASVIVTPPTCSNSCDAVASCPGVTGGTAPYSFLWTPAPPVGQGTPTASDLCPGAYSLLITDANGCDTTIAFTIAPAAPYTIALVTTPTGCAGQCNGTAIATVTGALPPYTYDWAPDPITGDGTPSVSALCAGVYTLTVTDAAGCDTTLQFVITTPSGIVSVPTVTDASCAGECSGAIDLVTTGGVAPYTYNWTPEPGTGQGSPNAGGLCAGNWTVQITDAVGCDTLLIIAVDEPTPILPNGTSTNETCNGPCDGTAEVAPTGGSAPYTYFWSPVPPNGQGTPVANDLCAGDWSVTITDAAGCDTTVTFTILPNAGIDAGLVALDGPCPDECGGSATVTPTGGVAPYTFLWSPAPGAGQGTDAVTGLCVGGYFVTVTDAIGCDTTINFIIEKPAPFEPNLVVQPEDCNGACTGAAAVFPAGATPGYTYLWTPAPGSGQGTNVVFGLCAGTNYTVTITDANLCDTTVAFTVPPFEQIIPNVSSTPVSCAGTCDGTATFGPTGGQAPYTYFWSPIPANGQGVAQGTGMCEGVYDVTITDASNCSITTQVLITGPAPFTNTGSVTNVSCNGACDGEIGVNVQGGTQPYTYLWTPVPPSGQGTPTATDLCEGTWTVLVTDGNGCDSLFSFEVTEPDELILQTQSTPSECQVCVGTVTCTILGGTPGYTITWTNSAGVVVGNTDNLTGLCADVYTVTVIDDNGCTRSQAVPVSDADGEALTMLDGTTSCPNECDGSVSVTFTCSDAPCVIAWFDVTGTPLGIDTEVVNGLCPGDYIVSVTNASGCVSIDTATVVAPPAATYSITSTPVSCAGDCDGSATVGFVGGLPPFTFTWTPAPGSGQGTPVGTGLCAGVYDVLVADGSGCDTTLQVLIIEPAPFVVDAAVNSISCNAACDASITLSASGGVASYSVIWTPVPPNGQGVLVAEDLCAGTWTALVTDANGCSITLTFDLTEPALLTVGATSTPSSCGVCDGTASSSVTGGTSPYTYSWSLGGTVVSTDPDATNLCAGAYTLLVTDANGCTATAQVTIADADGEVLIPEDGQVTCSGDCNGVVSVFFNCSTTPCTTIWTDADGNIIAQNQLSVPDLCVGTYTVQVTNGAGCVSFAEAVVAPSQTIVPNLSTTPVTCAGLCDGTATVGPTGGVAPYTFLWTPEPGGGQNSPQVTGLCAGVYTVLIADASGCDTTVQVLILAPTALSMDATVNGISCAGECDGSISVVPQGGIAPYTFLWSPAPPVGQGTATISELCAGSYTLTLTDANGCTLDSTWQVVEPGVLVLQGSSTLSNCGACDGTASVAITGGTQPYFVQWTSFGAIIGSGETITDRCAGIYIATVTDANGCEASLLVPISDVEGEDLNTVDGITSCPDACDGTVEMSFVCTDPPCIVTWFDATGTEIAQAVGQVTGLCAGDYFVQVSNNTGCISIDTATVASPDPIVANLSTTPVACFGDCNGTATVAPAGGAPPYEYTWSPEPATGQGTPSVTGLCVGTATVTITDDIGCTIVQDVLILGPDPITVTPTLENASCSGVCDGSITLLVQGGVAPYTYLWNPAPPNGAAGPTAEDLCAGDWQVLITDANGCDTLLTYTITQPAALEAVLATTDNTCYGDCLGLAEVFIQGGTAPFVVTWRNVAGDVIAPDQTAIDLLCAGDYSVTITDGNGCTFQQPFSIGQGAPIDPGLVTTDETCAGPCNGTATCGPTGGTGPYTFFWQPEPPVGQGTGTVSGLCAGNYTVTITDAIGCDTTVALVILPYVPIDPGATVNPETCAGGCDGSVVLAATGGVGNYTYAWTPEPPNGQGNPSATGLCPGDITVVITDAVFCSTSITFTITGPPVLTLAVDEVVLASCVNANDGAISVTAGGGVAPITVAWSGPSGFFANTEDISGLIPGDYIITVTDNNGCDISDTITVGALSDLLAVAGDDQQACAGPDVVLDGSLSTGVLTYTWTNDQGTVIGDQPVITLTGLAAGLYTFTLTVTDGGICTSTDQVTVVVLALPLADAGGDRSIFLGASTSLGGSPTGPQGSVFTWTPDSTLSAANVANPLATPSVSTWYDLVVVAPNGCIASDSVLITVLPDVVIPSGFSPNGDGWNDAWVIDLIDQFPDCEVEIYSRWGELLFQSVGYRTPWDGRYNNGPVPVGTYYYVVKLNDPEYPEPYTGPLTVIR
ncbi:MAG: gliding motility-associated C-terminal domain-containing protein [Flavobacteriales bacterium]|nr:gliding motility-associated C-terminal domain-containing protein [Flavobacteriales bacterium]